MIFWFCKKSKKQRKIPDFKNNNIKSKQKWKSSKEKKQIVQTNLNTIKKNLKRGNKEKKYEKILKIKF